MRAGHGASEPDLDLSGPATLAGAAVLATDATELVADRAEMSALFDWLDAALSEPTFPPGDAHRLEVARSVGELRADLDDGADPEALVDRVRACFQLTAALRTLGHWQSPVDRPGIMVYHRQQVPEDRWLEAVATAAPVPGTRSEQVFFFSSFMGAIGAFLITAPPGPLLMDSATYWETRDLVSRLGGRTVHTVDPRDPGRLLAALEQIQPSVVLLDLAPNQPEIPLCRLSDAIGALGEGSSERERWTLLDHSLLGPVWDPLPGPTTRGHVVMLGRSLQKLDQRGLDLSSGGILVGYGLDDERAARLASARGILGVELPEQSRWYLELPDRAVHRSRRLRAFRNGRWIRQAIGERSPRWPGVKVVHTSEEHHPIWQLEPPLWRWCPPILHVELPADLAAVVQGPHVQRDLASAATGIVVGASFGFRHTRVGWWHEGARASLRVDLGLERASAMPGVVEGLAGLLDHIWALV